MTSKAGDCWVVYSPNESATSDSARVRVSSLMWAWSALAWSTEFSTLLAASAVLVAM